MSVGRVVVDRGEGFAEREVESGWRMGEDGVWG